MPHEKPSFEEPPREELQLQEVDLKPRTQKKPSSHPEVRLPSRGETDGDIYEEIFKELLAGGKPQIDEAHGVYIILDRYGEPMTDIPIAKFEELRDAASKKVLDGVEKDIGNAMQDLEDEIDRGMRGKDLGH